MKCPSCGGQRLRIEVVFSASVACEFGANSSFEMYEPAALDSHWHDRSECACDACGWTGFVQDARDGVETTLGSDWDHDPDSRFDLECLEREIEQGTCPTEIADPVKHLIEVVHNLQRQVKLLQRVNSAISRSGEGDPHDTKLF